MIALNHHKKNTKGFTLLEVMVSMALLSIVLLSVFSLHSSTVSLAGSDKFRTTALFLMKSALSNLEIKTQEELSGRFPPPHDRIQWKARIGKAYKGINNLSREAPGLLQQIVLEIRDPHQDLSYTITTWRYRHGT